MSLEMKGVIFLTLLLAVFSHPGLQFYLLSGSTDMFLLFFEFEFMHGAPVTCSRFNIRQFQLKTEKPHSCKNTSMNWYVTFFHESREGGGGLSQSRLKVPQCG